MLILKFIQWLYICLLFELQPSSSSSSSSSSLNKIMEKERSAEDWQLAKKRISERLQHLLACEQWTDCKFIVESNDNQKVFNAHKLVLAMSSPVFEAMFFGGIAEHKNEIIISDVQPNAFQVLLEYIYSDKIHITTLDEACEVCYAAKKYMLPDLVEQCTQKIFQHLSARNACKAYEFAKLIDLPLLMDRSLQIIEQETETVLADSSFEDVQLATMLMILDLKFLNIPSEIHLIDAVFRWATKECKRKGLHDDSTNLRLVVGPALEKIRFLSLTPLQFSETPARAQLLTEREALSIFVKFANPTSSELPPDFSTLTECRNKEGSNNDHKYVHFLKLQKPDNGRGLPCRFSTNRDVIIFGIKIVTEMSSQSIGSSKPAIVSLFDTHGRCVSEAWFPFQVGKDQDVYFDRPAAIKKCMVYTMSWRASQPPGANNVEKLKVFFTFFSPDDSRFRTFVWPLK